MDNTDYSILVDLESAENQKKKREQLALEMMGDDGFLSSMLTPEQRARAKGQPTQAETAAQEQWQASLDDTSRMIARQQQAAQRAVEVTERQLKQAEDALDDIHDRAAKTEDGQAVYRTKDGTKAYYEDGRQMTEREMADVNWKPDMPTWEELQAGKEAAAAAQKAHDDAKAYADRVDYYADRVQSGDVTAEELADIKTDLNAMPQSVRDQMTGAQADSSPVASTAGLTGNFQQAASDLTHQPAVAAPNSQLTAAELADLQAMSTPKRPDSKPGFGN